MKNFFFKIHNRCCDITKHSREKNEYFNIEHLQLDGSFNEVNIAIGIGIYYQLMTTV